MPTTMRVEIRVAWWFRWLYLPGLNFMAQATGLEPNWEKVSRIVARAVTVRAA